MLKLPEKQDKFPEAFTKLIEEYNKLPDGLPDRESSEYQSELKDAIKKIFLLQKITHFMDKAPTHADMVHYRHQTGEGSYEEELQRYGVHRDASILLQSVEFANIVNGISKELTEASEPETSENTIYEAMQRNESLFEEETEEDNLKAYVAGNQAIMEEYAADDLLKENIAKQRHVLALVYSKLDTIQGFVEQNFDAYKTKVLGDSEGNNKNFTLHVEGEDVPLVIRVENRGDLEREKILQRDPVSRFFSQDYASLILPFEEDGELFYRPVVFSEYAEKGSLEDYSKNLQGETASEILDKTNEFMGQISDFSEQLIASGHYHPDIKLSNFLTDGERVFVSDRKTFITEQSPSFTDIASTFVDAPPEYRDCFRITSSGNIIPIATKMLSTKFNMEQFMSYQTGMALKEFLLNSQGKPTNDMKFMLWSGIPLPDSVELNEEERNQYQNLSVLSQELTRTNPEDRLPPEIFKLLLDATTELPPEMFLEFIEELSPKEELSSSKDLNLLVNYIENGEVSSSDEKDLIELLQSDRLENLLHETRINIPEIIEKSDIFKQARSKCSSFSEESASNQSLDDKTNLTLLLFKSLPDHLRLVLPEEDIELFESVVSSHSADGSVLQQSPAQDAFSEKGSMSSSALMTRMFQDEFPAGTFVVDSDAEANQGNLDEAIESFESENPVDVDSGTFVFDSGPFVADGEAEANQGNLDAAIEYFENKSPDEAASSEVPTIASEPSVEASSSDEPSSIEKQAKSIKETVERGDKKHPEDESVEEDSDKPGFKP